MAKPPVNPVAQEAEPPRQFANVPPQDLHPTSDIRFVMVELSKVGTKLDRLIEDVGKQSTKIELLERAIDRVKTGAIVAIAILSVVAALFWWALGDRITSAVRTGLLFPMTSEKALPKN